MTTIDRIESLPDFFVENFILYKKGLTKFFRGCAVKIGPAKKVTFSWYCSVFFRTCNFKGAGYQKIYETFFVECLYLLSNWYGLQVILFTMVWQVLIISSLFAAYWVVLIPTPVILSKENFKIVPWNNSTQNDFGPTKML